MSVLGTCVFFVVLVVLVISRPSSVLFFSSLVFVRFFSVDLSTGIVLLSPVSGMLLPLVIFSHVLKL